MVLVVALFVLFYNDSVRVRDFLYLRGEERRLLWVVLGVQVFILDHLVAKIS